MPFATRFSAPIETGPGAHPASYTMDTGSFPEGKERPGRGGNHPPHQVPRLKQDQSYTSTLPLGLRGLFQGELYIYLIIIIIIIISDIFLTGNWPVKSGSK